MLVGRDTERRRLDALLAAARLGQSGVLVLSGEAGIGKTALLDDLRSRARDIRVLSTAGTEAERDLPFAGLAQLLRVTVADLATLPAPQAAALGVALALRPGSNVDRFAVGAGLLTLLAHRSEAEPLCLVVDDAHLLDQPSADALLFVARRLLADAIAFVIAVRGGEPCRLADPALPHLRLSGIDEAAGRILVRAAAGSADPDSATERMTEHVLALSLGNPLAIRELVADPAALVEDRWDLGTAGPLPRTLPDSLPESLMRGYARRAAQLAPTALTAARCAAVAGDDLAVITRACAALDVPVTGLAAAEGAGLLSIERDTVRFGHPLIRSALWASAPPTVRRQLHAAAAAALAGSDADRRAWHLSEAVLGPDDAVAAELDALAARAADRSAYAVAARAAERAAVLSTAAGDRTRRLLTAGVCAWRAGDIERARRSLADVAGADPTGALGARADHVRGVLLARSGSVAEARDLLRSAAERAPDRVDALASLAEAVNACFYLGDAAAAGATADTIEGLLDAGCSGSGWGGAGPDADAEARAAIAAGCARVLAGADGARLIRTGLDRLAVADAGDEPALATWAVLGPLFLRDSSTGRTQMERAVHARRARAAVGELPHLLFHIARDEAAGDHWDRAEADYLEAIALARELGQSTELAASLAGLCWLEARCGRAADSRAHGEEAHALCRRHHIHAMEVWTAWAAADLAYAAGSVETALTRYLAIEDQLTALGLRDVDLSPVPEIVECSVRLGRTDRIRELMTGYGDRARAKGQPWAIARAARLVAVLVDDDQVDAAFSTALAQHDLTLDVFERARTLLWYGGRLRRARRRIDARAQLQEALDVFVRLGAAPWAATAADELAATGATVARPGQSPRSRLTPRELQIAVLLTEGRTTRETASTLFLSPKTVEYHLRNIYTKLGVGTRSELATRLGQN